MPDPELRCRPNRFEVIRGLVDRLNPAGQLVLTFPSYGTFDSLWQRVEQALLQQGLANERTKFQDYLNERPSARERRGWLRALALERVEAIEYPLEVATGPGDDFSIIRCFAAAFSMTCTNVLRISPSPIDS